MWVIFKASYTGSTSLLVWNRALSRYKASFYPGCFLAMALRKVMNSADLIAFSYTCRWSSPPSEDIAAIADQYPDPSYSYVSLKVEHLLLKSAF